MTLWILTGLAAGYLLLGIHSRVYEGRWISPRSWWKYYPGRHRLHAWWLRVMPDKMAQRYWDRQHHRWDIGGGFHLRPCSYCATPTKQGRMKVNADTLRRKKVPICSRCQLDPSRHFDDSEARQRRTKKDWSEMTTPIETEMLTDEMGEQYPAKSRAAIRAFMDGGMSRAELRDINSAETIQQSILTLGLGDEMYAETRGDVVVLRRIEQGDE